MFHPVVSAWLSRRFESPTPAQEKAWPLIADGRDVLVTAPTGSGKTLAAFLACLDRLIVESMARGGVLDDRTAILYVSPLKALSNDIRRNLEEPLAELRDLAVELGYPAPPIRTAVRTGDTTARERREATRRPPHVLVTTPESLYILLTSDSGRKALRDVRTVIVDEIHAVAADKRGAHLALSLERLESLVSNAGGSLQRIGLSATVNPLSVAGHLLCGAGRPLPAVVDVGQRRDLDLAIEVLQDELGAVCTNEQWGEIYDRLADMARAHRSTIVFVNTRRLVERLAHHLGERLGQDVVAAHHGSLSRERRHKAERRLKDGELKLVVATASLELGIDVGAVDLACLVGSPRSIATGLQRIGRSGHALQATPKGRLFPLTRDQLVECAALVRAARRAQIDAIALRDAPLDVLAQQIVAMCSCEDWDEDALYAVCRKAAPYATLDRAQFDQIVDMLSEGIATSRGRSGAMLHRDAVARRLRGRRGARLGALTSGGAIPDNANYNVLLEPEGTLIGTLDEDFAIETLSGDVILLGNSSWRVRRVEAGVVRVEDAAGAPPTIPFWLGEGPARTRELSAEVAVLREEAVVSTPSDTPAAREEHLAALMKSCALDRRGADLVRDYLRAGQAALGAVPTQKRLIAERFFDEGGGMQLVIHAPFGGRINRAWGMALRKKFCRSFDFELQAAATDDGIVLSLGAQHSFPLEMVFQMVRPDDIDETLTQAALQAPMFETRWRWNAMRSLALLRQQGGRRVPPQIQRMRAQDLIAAVFPAQLGCQDNHGGGAIEVPDHPLVRETVRDCLTEAMDAAGLRAMLTDLLAGRIETIARDVVEPSVFAHEILNANPYAFLDDAPLEERRTRAVAVRRGLPADVADRIGGLDPERIAEVVAEAQPDVRGADELHDLLLDLGGLPEALAVARGWGGFFDQLVAARRAACLMGGAVPLWVAAERRTLATLVWPDREFLPDLVEPPARRVPAWTEREGALTEVVRAHLSLVGPTTAPRLSARLDVPTADIEAALARVEMEGGVLRGHFNPDLAQTHPVTEPVARAAISAEAPTDPDRVAGARSAHAPNPEPDRVAGARSAHAPNPEPDRVGEGRLRRPEPIAGGAGPSQGPELQWCDRRLLARINRRMLDGLRREIEPATTAEYIRFLLGWQHVRPGTQVAGRAGLAQVVAQLQGFEIAAGAWERDILPARVTGYDPAWLDALCLSGEVAWGRLAPREAASAPSRAAPIALVQRRDLPWMLCPPKDDVISGLSAAAQDVLRFLSANGASFLDEIIHGAGRLRSEVEDALWELVSAGRVTGDGFGGLRALLSATQSRGGARARWHARWTRRMGGPVGAGRWALLRAPTRTGPDEATAATDSEDLHEAFARQYVKRYGVVLRDVLAREPHAPSWRDLLKVYRRLEMRGELRGGRLVGGFVGEQFAAPEAVEALRAVRRQSAQVKDGRPLPTEVVRVSACDPLNLVGILTPGPRVPATLANTVTFRDGVPEADAFAVQSPGVTYQAIAPAGSGMQDEL